MRMAWICAATVSFLVSAVSIGWSHADSAHRAKGCPIMGTADCPMTVKLGTKESAHDHLDHVNQRGDQVMGFPHSKSVHHFTLSKLGGEIRVEAIGSGDGTTVDLIRSPLKHVASDFTTGDFRMPSEIHGRVVPGTPEMNRRRSEISYRYEPLRAGGRVLIVSRDPVAIEAVHEFLRFQIRDHATGDPATPRS